MPQNLGYGLEAESNYWVQFWQEHGRRTSQDDPSQRVLRTLHGEPIGQCQIDGIVEHTLSAMDLFSAARVADLACGTGLFTLPIASRTESVLAVDVSEEFIEQLASKKIANIQREVADIRALELGDSQFDRILLYAAIQYLSEADVVRFLQRTFAALKPRGILYIGDVPNSRCQWKFFNSSERRRNYFQNLALGTPILGNWFDPEWLIYAGEAVGYAQGTLIPQPEAWPYAHYRIDVRFRRTE